MKDMTKKNITHGDIPAFDLKVTGCPETVKELAKLPEAQSKAVIAGGLSWLLHRTMTGKGKTLASKLAEGEDRLIVLTFEQAMASSTRISKAIQKKASDFVELLEALDDDAPEWEAIKANCKKWKISSDATDVEKFALAYQIAKAENERDLI